MPLPTMTAAFVQALSVPTAAGAVDCTVTMGYRYAVVRNIRAWQAPWYTPVGRDASVPSVAPSVALIAPERLRQGLWRKLLRKRRLPPIATSPVAV